MIDGSNALQYDEQGRPYFQLPGQRRNYVSPVAMGGEAPEDTTGILRSRPQWNQHAGTWETPIDWGNILNVGVGSGLGLGALNAAGVIGGGAAASGTGGATAGLGPSTPANIAATSAAAGSVPASLAAGASGAGGNLITNALKNLGLKDYAALGTALASLFGPGGAFNGGRTAGEQGIERIR